MDWAHWLGVLKVNAYRSWVRESLKAGTWKKRKYAAAIVLRYILKSTFKDMNVTEIAWARVPWRAYVLAMWNFELYRAYRKHRKTS
jgi:hypothetical protein